MRFAERTLLAALFGLPTSCSEPTAPAAGGPRNVLLISVDTLRADHLGCYGYEPDTSPHIDRLARNGTVFEGMVSSSCWTLPAHASMLTGQYPAAHGLEDDGVRLPASVATLAEAMRDAGYHTLGVVSHVYVSSAFGLDRGFQNFDETLIEGGTRNPVASEVVERFLMHLDAAPEGPIFAFVHFFDPHWGYAPPSPFRERFVDERYRGVIDGSYESMVPFVAWQPMEREDREQLLAYYDGEIAYVDDQIGRLVAGLKERGLWNNTILALTSDHGEEFKDHGALGHGRTLFQEQLAVPLIISGAGLLERGTRRTDLASPIDLAPTLLELCGAAEAAPLAGRFPGRSLARPGPERVVISESIRLGFRKRAARLGPYKLIRAADRLQFFDLSVDAVERSPLLADPTDGKLSSALLDYESLADRGWHLNFVDLTDDSLTCEGTIRTSGRLVNARRYFSANLSGSTAEFDRFMVSADGSELSFSMKLVWHLGSVVFETDPPDSPVTFDLRVTCDDRAAGVFLGRSSEPQVGSIELQRDDERLATRVDVNRPTAPGVYIRAVTPEPGTSSDLSSEVLHALEGLGYTGRDEDG